MKRSKVARLPLHVRAEIERAWREGKLTLDEIMAFARKEKVDIDSDPVNGVSRSGLHRYLQSFGEAAERMRKAESMAGSVLGSLNESTGGNTRRMLTHLLTMVAMRLSSEAEAGDSKTGPKELMFLAKAIRDIGGTFKSEIDSEAALRKLIAAEVSKKAGPALEQLDAAAKAGGLAPETAKAIRQAIAEIDV